MMNISIVLSTYNGEKYIVELLDSLRNQTLTANEVIIRDDCSKDKTVEIVREYIDKNCLNSWRLKQNDKNLGWEKNFIQGIFEANGDIIFPCDQDDIWKHDKIEEMYEVFKKKEDALLVCGDYELLYMNSATRFPRTYISKLQNNEKIEKVKSNKAYFVVDRPGCTYAIHKNLIPYMKKMWFEGYAHDALAWRAAFLYDGLYIYHRPVIVFRRHANNASDSKRDSRESRISSCEYFVKVIQEMQKCINKADKTKKKYLARSEKLQTKRKSALVNESIWQWLCLIRYIFFYPRITSYFADGLCILKNKTSM